MSQSVLPMTFRLPGPQWRQVDPASVGVQGAAFFAARSVPAGEYTPTISVSGGPRQDAAPLSVVADEALTLFRAQAEDVELVSRTDSGSEEVPGLTQLMGGEVTVDGRRYDLRQGQAMMRIADVEDPSAVVIVIYTLTSTYAQFESVVPEFQQFVASARIGEAGEQ